MSGLADLVGDFVVNNKTFTLQAGFATTLVGPDPTRWALSIGVGTATSQIQIGVFVPAGIIGGMFIGASNTPWEVNFRDYGSLVNLSWYGIGVNGGDTVSFVEVLYRPSGPTIGLDDLAAELAQLRRQSRAIPDHYRRQLSELRQQLSSVPHIGARK